MIIKSEQIFDAEKSMEVVTKDMTNIKGSLLVIEVYGSASSFNLGLYGSTIFSTEGLMPLGFVQASSYDVLKTITVKGIYMADISALRYLKFQLSDVVGGDVSVHVSVKEA